MELRAKIAVVAGATGGLGSELVKRLDAEGVSCILISKTQEKLENLISGLSGEGHRYIVSDFRKTEDLESKIKELNNSIEKVDLLFNTMGIGIYHGIDETSLDEWGDTLAINLTSPFVLIKSFMPKLLMSDSAVVVNIGSGLGREIYWKNRISYITSKFGLRGMSLALSKDYEEEKVKFSYIALGSILTDFGPGGISERLNKQKEGKKYFTPDWVAKKLIEHIKKDQLDQEWVLYPGNYTHDELK